nr:MAG TPA: hypothetical protein [Caudoviricetes sp.]
MLTNKICARHIFTFKDTKFLLHIPIYPYLSLYVVLGCPLAVPFLYS